ncbi:MAG: hypothetical protein OHK0029_30650 [Armatimonadaceae bacterium]
MTDTETLRLLRWGMRPETPPPALSAMDASEEKSLLALIGTHKLSGRFLEGVRRHRPKWASRSLLFSIYKQQEGARAQYRRHLAALHELTDEIAKSSQEPIITVKGFATHALTGSEKHLRFSGDLDLFHAQKEMLYEVALRLGYTGEITGSHDWARLSRGGVNLDIMHNFPVPSYPNVIREANVEDLDPTRHPGVWRVPLDGLGTEKTIEYADLLPDAVEGSTPETRKFLVPDAPMSAFIYCVHLFRHHIGGPCTCFLPRIRLGELADVWDLTTASGFQMKRFLNIVEQFQGHEAVAFAGRFLLLMYGENPVALAADPLPERFPERLVWYGPHVVIHSLESMILTIDPRKILQQLGTANVVADGRTYVMASEESAESTILSRTFLTAGEKTIRAHLRCYWRTAQIEVEMEFPDTPPPHRAYYAHLQYDIFVFREESTLGGVLRIAFPFAEVKDAFVNPESLVLLLGLSFRSVGDSVPWQFPHPVTVIALEIVKPGPDSPSR